MTSPVFALRKAVRERLTADATLTALLGGAKIYDIAPRDAASPCVTFGDASLRDWSTSSDRGAEQRLELHCWSQQGGAREALATAARLVALCDEAALTLEGHRLVRISFMGLERRRLSDGRVTRASLRFRALTEEA